MPALRFDRLITLGLFQPARQTGIGAAEFRLPILMYHSVSDDPQSGVAPYYKTTTSPAVFDEHMRFLKESGFRSVTMPEGMRLLRENRLKSEKAVIITFDDGFRDFYDSAFPILQKHGHTAVMYLPTAFIGKNRRSFRGTECLTWKEVRELHAAGIQFGSHTVNHPVLYDLSWKEIEGELTHSRKKLEDELHQPVTSFAYPYAFPQEDVNFTRTFLDHVRGAGYQDNVTTMIGGARSGDDQFCLKRLPANSCDDRALLAAKIRGAYDWLSVPQSVFRRAKIWAGRTRRRANQDQPPAGPSRAARYSNRV